MDQPAQFRVNRTSDGVLVGLTGRWSGPGIDKPCKDLAHGLSGLSGFDMDLSGVDRMDTTAAYLLIRATDGRLDLSRTQGRPEVIRLLELVSKASNAKIQGKRPPSGFHELTIRIGRGAIDLYREFIDTMVFVGHLLVVLGRLTIRPQKSDGQPVSPWQNGQASTPYRSSPPPRFSSVLSLGFWV